MSTKELEKEIEPGFPMTFFPQDATDFDLDVFDKPGLVEQQSGAERGAALVTEVIPQFF